MTAHVIRLLFLSTVVSSWFHDVFNMYRFYIVNHPVFSPFDILSELTHLYDSCSY